MKLIFATHNSNKVLEIKSLLNSKIEVISLKEINDSDEIIESGKNLEENASLKSKIIYEKYKINCFADDTGLEVKAINNEPGVFSARYAGEHGNSELNIQKLLSKLNGVTDRQARFRTVISLIINGAEKIFDGIIEGEIAQEKSGIQGFGYDPIFIPKGYSVTFAQMLLEEKNKISHRAIAFEKLIDHLNNLQ
jgi:XTP/dITP diphosphohydrolase